MFVSNLGILPENVPWSSTNGHKSRYLWLLSLAKTRSKYDFGTVKLAKIIYFKVMSKH
jgi:hypothetical protein